MRARRRRSVLNTISAAALEVAIMGIFVIIAQPQLRDALFEILQVDPAHVPAQVASQTAPSQRPASPPASLDRAVQAVVNSPVGQAVENSLAKWTGGQLADMNVPSLSMQPSSQLQSQPVTAPPLLPSTATSSANTNTRNQPVQNHLTGYSPYEQFESLRVSVPPANTHQQPLAQQPFAQQPTIQQPSIQQPSAQQPLVQQPLVQQPSAQRPSSLFGSGAFTSQSGYTNPGAYTGAPQYALQQYAIPHYVPPQNYGSSVTNYTVPNYTVPNYTVPNNRPTQLTANQWNIGSAVQSQYPNTQAQSHNNSWIPTHATETSFRQVAPPYGTQSMWK